MSWAVWQTSMHTYDSNGYEQPVYWLRFNPDGKYFVGDEERSISREEREVALKSHTFSMMKPGFGPIGNENTF